MESFINGKMFIKTETGDILGSNLNFPIKVFTEKK